MLFNTSAFLAFIVAVFIAYHFALRSKTQQVWFLFFVSLVFYAGFSFRFLPYLLGTGLIDFYIAGVLNRSEDERRRRTLVVVSLCMNLGVLGYFKYANFFLANITAALGAAGIHLAPRTLDIVLPVGISFYTFQSISYVLDVYRGVFTPRKSLHEFLASLTFFPHLVAGPIVRSSQFLPQFQNPAPLQLDAAMRGLLLISAGLIKKTLADLIAPLSDAVFAGEGPYSALRAWTGTLAFTAQVYGDFSGYTDIAIGVAALLGFYLPKNFDLPYLASSPVDFWRRWHISLSTWLRDYLYMPLALRFRSRPDFCLLVTWLLAGLWHGANWTFVAWGLYHGLLLVATHRLTRYVPKRIYDESSGVAVRVVKRLVTLYLVAIGYVLFRSPHLAKVGEVLRGMHAPTVPSWATYAECRTLAVVIAILVGCHALDHLIRRLEARPTERWFPVMVFSAAVTSLIIAAFFGATDQRFIYFQF
jgi:D-alanyl-lipoteichoic acid acyltransferase DltB (MBOAT superfamily)